MRPNRAYPWRWKQFRYKMYVWRVDPVLSRFNSSADLQLRKTFRPHNHYPALTDAAYFGTKGLCAKPVRYLNPPLPKPPTVLVLSLTFSTTAILSDLVQWLRHPVHLNSIPVATFILLLSLFQSSDSSLLRVFVLPRTSSDSKHK